MTNGVSHMVPRRSDLTQQLGKEETRPTGVGLAWGLALRLGSLPEKQHDHRLYGWKPTDPNRSSRAE